MAAYPRPGAARQGTVQNVSYTSTAATLPNPVGGQTFQVRLAATSAAFYLVTEAANVVNATATNGSFLPANWVEIILVNPGEKISVIQAPTNGLVTGTAGTLSVTELS